MIPINVIPVDDTITTSKKGMAVAKWKLEQQGLGNNSKNIRLIQSHAADKVVAAGFTIEVGTSRLELSSSAANQSTVILLEDREHHRDALKSINSSCDATTLTRISISRSNGII